MKVIGNYLPSDMDFKPAILKAKTDNYDIVGIFLFVGQISLFYRQAATLHYQPITFGADDFESKSEIAASQGGMNNAVFALNKISEDFATRYRKRFGTDTHLTYAANGYDFANLVSLLLPWNADQTGAQMIARLTQVRLPAGALGAAEFRQSEDGGKYFRFPIVIKKVVGQEVEVVSE